MTEWISYKFTVKKQNSLISKMQLKMNTNETVLEIKTNLTNIQEKCHRQLHSHFNNLLKKELKL